MGEAEPQIESVKHDYITIDFETRSAINIVKTGAYRYAEDSSTEILCMAYKIRDEEVKMWIPKHDEPFPKDLLEEINSGTIIEAHNAEFERAIWQSNILEVPCPPINQWRCSAAKVAACALPRALGNAVDALGLPDCKDDEGKRVMMQLARPRVTSKDNPDQFWEESIVPEKFEQLYEYCIDDVHAEVGLSAAVPDLSDREQEIWFLDQKINNHGINIDIESIQKILWCIDRLQERMDKKTSEVTKGELHSVRQRNAFIAYFEKEGYPLEDATAATIEEWAKRKDLPEHLETLIKHRLVQSKTTTAKFQSMIDRACHDNRIRGSLKYHGASTGRWSGSGVQPHNLPRGNLDWDKITLDEVVDDFGKADIDFLIKKYPNPFDAAASCLRGMLIPSEGKTFFCSDFASIEARVLMWVAGDRDALDIFESGQDIYKDMAASIYKVTAEEITDEQRQVGKMAILGLGYGMGWKTFIKQADKMGVEIDESFAKMVVDTYRYKYSKVKSLWTALERAATLAVETPGNVYRVAGLIKYCVHNEYLSCMVPSGRVIRYYKPSIEDRQTPWGQMKPAVAFMATNSFTRKWTSTNTYGGKLAENVVQAIARDFMAEAMLRVDEAGYDIVLTVHDELIVEADKGADFGAFNNLMQLPTPWGANCPIEADGWEGKRYKK